MVATWKQKLLACLKRHRKLINIEPIIFFQFMAQEAYTVVSTTGLYNKICRQNYGQNSSVNCRNLKVTPIIETIIQKKAAQWQIYIALGMLLPLIFSGLILGTFGDRNGRKINVLVGCLGAIGLMFAYLVEFAIVDMPLSILPPMAFVVCCTSAMNIISPSCYAYLSDRIYDRDLLTIRFVILQIFTKLAYIIVGPIVGVMLKRYGYARTALLPICLWFITFFYSLWYMKQISPTALKDQYLKRKAKDVHMKAIKSASNIVGPMPSIPIQNGMIEPTETSMKHADEVTQLSAEDLEAEKEINLAISLNKALETEQKTRHSIFRETYDLLVDALIMARKKREYYYRTYMAWSIICFVVLITVQIGLHSTLALFCLHAPLNWTPSEYAFYGSYSAGMQMIGDIFGVIVFKAVLKLHETTIMIIALGSLTLRMVMIGASQNTAMMLIAGFLGILGDLGYPISKALAVQFVAADEVGRLYALFQLGVDGGILLSFTLFNAIYYWSVGLFAGAVFELTAVLLVIALGGMIWVHMHYSAYRLSKGHAPNEPKWNNLKLCCSQ